MLSFGKTAQITLALALPTSIVLLYWWYKHRPDEGTYEKKRVVTSKNTVIEVTVPQQAVGSVIGRQGSKIKQIQKETGTWLHFEGKDDYEGGGGDSSNKAHRVLVIKGTPESAQQAELMVHQIIASIPQIFTEEIEVPQHSLGRIIGKGGSTIRELTSISGAKIIVNRTEGCKDLHHPQTVTLTGSRQQIDAALELIQDKLEEEERFRAEISLTAASREVRNKNKNTEEHVRVAAVPRKDESWDISCDVTSASQEKLLNNICIEVYVSAVEHPGHFWVQVIGTKALQLERLQNDITSFASSHSAKLNYSVTEVNVGELVAARFTDEDSTYYRAKVLGETEDGKVDLYFVDYGDNAFTEKKDIFRLRPDFTSLPFQAVECMLANVAPVDGIWSEDAISSFEEMTYCAEWKIIQASVIAYTTLQEGQKMPVVQLVDKNGPQEIDIGAELIKQGFALSVDSISICASGAGSDAQSCELAAPRHACSAASPESWLMTQTGDL